MGERKKDRQIWFDYYSYSLTMENSPRRVLTPEVREAAYNVCKYFQSEKENKTVKFGLDHAINHAADAMKISRTTLYQICREAKETEEETGFPFFRAKKRKR